MPDITPLHTHHRATLAVELIRTDPHAYLRQLALVLHEALAELDAGLRASDTELVLRACRRVHSIGVLAYSAAVNIVGEGS